MTKNLDEIQRELLGSFYEESLENLEQLETGLLALESSEHADADSINDVFRAAHSIKGGAGSFGLTEVVGLAHEMESLLDDYRSGHTQPTPASLALLLKGVDWLRSAVNARRTGSVLPFSQTEALIANLVELRKPQGAQPASHAAAGPAAPLSQVAGAECAHFKISFLPLPRLLESGNEPVRLLRELGKLGSCVVVLDSSKLPTLTEIDPTLCYFSWQIELSGPGVTRAAIEEVFSWVDGDAELEIEELPRDPLAALAPSDEPLPAAVVAATIVTEHEKPAGQPNEPRADSGTIGSLRVGVDKIDMLMNMVGELVITQSMLGTLDDDSPLDARRIEQLREGLGLLARNSRSLQESVMRLRSVPISAVFGRFPRLVHDLGQQLGKLVELKVSGQTTEIDKAIVEKLGDPLVHLIRNSLDHGLERPEVRRAAGKREVGQLELSARHHGGDVVVEVRDDGRGINREKVLQRAREAGLVGADEIPSEEAIRDLLFAPGFSTASVVSDVSGRGVGMDVVRRNIRALGGDVYIDSTPGKGTKISMRLPLTLAIIDGQLIRLGKHSYVVPLLSIIESVQVDPKRVSKYQGNRELYRLRDRLVPMVETGRVLGLETWRRSEESLMMIVEAEGEPVGLLVDELLAQQQVVVKSLETNYERVEGLSGATILGDGSVAFILDTAAIGKLARGVPPGSAHAA